MSFLSSCKLNNRLIGGGGGRKKGLMLRRFGMLLLDAHLKTKTSMVAAFPPCWVLELAKINRITLDISQQAEKAVVLRMGWVEQSSFRKIELNRVQCTQRCCWLQRGGARYWCLVPLVLFEQSTTVTRFLLEEG